METIEPPASASTDTELTPHFLLERDNTGDWPRWKRAAIGSVCFHLVAITILFLVKSGPYEPPPPERVYEPHIVHLYIPKDLTQRAPNKAQVAKLLMAPAIAPSPKLAEPAPKKAAAPPAPTPAPSPQQPAPKPTPVVAPATPTQTEVTRNQPPASAPPAVVPKPEAPKMIVEESIQAHPPAAKPAGLVPPSGNAVQDAMKTLSSGGGPSLSRTRVGDSDEVGVGNGLNLPPSAGRPQSSLEIKSDPMGVDFRPYLLRVLQEVRTNWFAVYPEAARLGTRGRVVLEFSVGKSGGVLKVVFAGQSGAKALDQAAVAAISASNPLPPLPAEFKGDNIVLQMSFMYNMPR